MASPKATEPTDNPTPAPAAAGARNARRTLRRWVGRALTFLVVGGVGAALVVGALPKPAPVDTARVRRGALRVTVTEDGRARVKDRYVIGSPLAGNLARIELRAGDAVTREQVLLRLWPLDAPLLDLRARSEAEARLQAAQAAQAQAQAAQGRAKLAQDFAAREAQQNERLATRGALPQQTLERSQLEARTRQEELASADFGVRVAAHQVDLARAALARFSAQKGSGAGAPFEVRSPIDGRVLRVQQQSAAVVTPGQPLLELGDPAALEIVVDILTQDAVQVRPGAPVSIERWGGPRDLRAHVRLIEPSAFTRVSALGVEEQRVNVLCDLDEPRSEWAALGDGYRVEGRIVLWEGQGVLAVPLSALFKATTTDSSGDSRWAVFVIENGKAATRPITIGHRGDLEAEVQDGLREGETVIVHPSDQIRAGVAVQAR